MTDKKRTIAHTLLEHWEQYRQLTLSDVTEPAAIVELRRAYFAGAHCLIYELDRAGQMDEDERAAHLVALNQEILLFAELAKDGLDRITPEGLRLEPDPEGAASGEETNEQPR